MADPSADRALLAEYLWQYNEYPDERPRVVAEIEARFRRRLALLVIDTSGFTRIVGEAGIIAFLARLELLARLVLPIVERFEGRLLKREADNFFAVFAGPRAAVRCSIEIREHVGVANEALPAGDELHVSLGVGFGDLLVIDECDAFGEEMNLACKLGEDLAGRGDILITPAAYAALADDRARFRQASYTVSGITLEAYRFEESAPSTLEADP